MKMFLWSSTYCISPPPLTQLNVSDDDSKGWMQASKSYDNLAQALRDNKKPDKKKGLLSRFRNFRKTHIRKSSKDKHRVSGSVAEVARVSSLTASMSMPDIACELFCLRLLYIKSVWAFVIHVRTSLKFKSSYTIGFLVKKRFYLFALELINSNQLKLAFSMQKSLEYLSTS